MTVYFIGAGPGAADLLTVRAVRILGDCDTCLYAGSLVPQEVLALCPPGVDLVDTARMPLDDIINLITAAHRRGHDVARLHSGDVSVYSAVAEQQRRLAGRDIPVQLVPGVPAFAAAAAALEQELTVPGVGQSLLLTRVSTLSTDMPPGEDLTTLAATGVTLALHLAAHRTEEIVAALAPSYGTECPTATVAFASRSNEQIVRCALADLPQALAQAEVSRTAVIFIGRVLADEESAATDSYLYSQARMTKLRDGQ